MKYFMYYIVILGIFTLVLFGYNDNPVLDPNLRFKIFCSFAAICMVCYTLGHILSFLFDHGGYLDRRAERKRAKQKHKS